MSLHRWLVGPSGVRSSYLPHAEKGSSTEAANREVACELEICGKSCRVCVKKKGGVREGARCLRLPRQTMASRAVWPCGCCLKPVKNNDAGVFCEVCHRWFHCLCVGINSAEYRELQVSDDGWCCLNCLHEALPFADSSSISLGKSLFNSPLRSDAAPSSVSQSVSCSDGCGVCNQSLLWPSLSTRRLVQKLCVCHSIVSGSSLIPANTFTTQSNRVRCFRDSKVLFKPYVRTFHHRSSFFIDTISKWNSVPVNIRSLTSHTAFKMHLKNFTTELYCLLTASVLSVYFCVGKP